MTPLKTLIEASSAKQSKSLVDQLCLQIQPDMLQEIAVADYGSDFNAHLAALIRLKHRKINTKPMAWEPQEVLELFRWSEYGDDRTGQRPRTPEVFHLMRAFCCAMLLEAATSPLNHDNLEGSNQTLVQLIESTQVLGSKNWQPLLEFIVWLIANLPTHEEDIAFFGVALIAARLHTGPIASDTDAKFLIDTAIACDAEFKKLQQTFGDTAVSKIGDRWLLGWTHFDQRHSKWQTIGKEIGVRSERVEHQELKGRLMQLSRWLTVDGAHRNDSKTA